MLENKHVMLYVTGSVAAYKAVELMRILQKKGAQVRVVMTRSAQKFVSPLTFAALSHQDPLLDDYPKMTNHQLTHIAAAQWTDIAIVMPATANFIAKISHGIADDLATTIMLATNALKVVVPAMNDQMWSNSATQRNIKQLQHDQVQIYMPTTGLLAEGYVGKGRLMEPLEIVKKLTHLTTVPLSQPLANQKILITAGGTREQIDPVRFVTNNSSGKMGYSIAKVARDWGAQVTLISGPVNLTPPRGVKLISVVSTRDLERAVLKHFPQFDILIMTAAVADFMVGKTASQKIKKHPGQSTIKIEFILAPDILQEVAKIKTPHQYTVGFAAETNDVLQNANRKLKRKQLNMLVANDVSNNKIGFNSDNNQVTFLKPHQKPLKTAIASKMEIAKQLLQQIINDYQEER